MRQYEKCCNSTCCNRHISSCLDGFQPGTVGSAGRTNALNFNVPFQMCSEVENLTARRTLFVFVFPTMFLVATMISLALVIILARRATEHYFDLTEQAMVVFATGIVFLSCAFYFSPQYKYGIVMAFTGLFTIVTAVIRRFEWSLVLIFVIFGLLLFLVDPFNGNIYLSLSSGVPPNGDDPPNFGLMPSNGNPDALTSGLFEAIGRLLVRRVECTTFYDWFNFDPLARDYIRKGNPNKINFGYCTRAWLMTLLIFAMFIVLFALILMMLAIISFIKKLAPPQGDEVIQLEVKRGSDVYVE